MDPIRTAHLFAGGGGGILADLILGHEPVLAIEIDKACCNSLRARQREGWLPAGMHIHQGDIRDFDWRPWANRVDCLAAGFPCQDISCAGSGAGIGGGRSGLVWEVFRAIDVARPGIVFLENSPRIRKLGRKEVVAELVARGYSWRDGTIAASDVGAPHRRSRWWLVAANADGMRQLEQSRSIADQWQRFGDCIASAADDLCNGLQRSVQRGWLSAADAAAIEAAARYTGAYHWAPPDAGICGVVDGLADQLDGNSKMARIHACGNGQVPLQAAAAWVMLVG